MFANPRLLGLFLLIFLNASCAQPLTPQDVAARFWAAIETGDAGDVRKYVTAADAAKLESLDDVLPISAPEFKRTVIEDKRAYIDTKVTIDGDKPLKFPLKTHLVMEDEQWKVDYERTVSAVTSAGKLAAVISKVHEFGAALQQGIDQSVQELEQSLPQIEEEISNIEQQIKQHVPELRKRLENFTRQLEEAIKKPPAKAAEENTGESVEI